MRAKYRIVRLRKTDDLPRIQRFPGRYAAERKFATIGPDDLEKGEVAQLQRRSQRLRVWRLLEERVG